MKILTATTVSSKSWNSFAPVLHLCVKTMSTVLSYESIFVKYVICSPDFQ